MPLFKRLMQACFALLTMFVLAGTSSSCLAQTITVNPPTYPNLSLPLVASISAARHSQPMEAATPVRQAATIL